MLIVFYLVQSIHLNRNDMPNANHNSWVPIEDISNLILFLTSNFPHQYQERLFQYMVKHYSLINTNFFSFMAYYNYHY